MGVLLVPSSTVDGPIASWFFEWLQVSQVINDKKQTFPAFRLFLRKGKQITSHLIAYFATRVNQAASNSSVSAFSVSVFFTSDSNKTVNVSMFYELLECENVWDGDLESNTQSFMMVCMSILCICKSEDGVKLGTIVLYTNLTTDQVSDLISVWHPAQGNVIFVMELTA